MFVTSSVGQETTTFWSTTTFTPDVTEYCPYHRTCGDGDDDEASTLWFDGCCLRCDCSDECFLKGNCCPGKKGRHYSINRICAQTFIDFLPDGSNGKIHYKNSSYILQLSGMFLCNNETKAKCLHPSRTQISESTPVLDKLHKINYRNRFCAQCDGAAEANMINWSVSISCVNTESGTLRYALKQDSNIIHLTREHLCMIMWEPPEPETALWCVHPDDIIDTCSFHDEYGSRRLKECQSRQLTNDTVHSPIFQNGGLYKNVVCADCNANLIPTASIQQGQCWGLIFISPPPRFVIMLDINAVQQAESPGVCLHYTKVTY